MRWLLAALLFVFPAHALGACDGPTMGEVTAALGSHGNGLAALVGDAPITDYDLAQNVALRIALDGDQQPDITRIGRDTLRELKREGTWIADARARNVAVAPAEVDAAIASLLARDHVTASALKARLAQSGVTMATLRARIAVGIAHGKALGAKTLLPFRIAQRRCG